MGKLVVKPEARKLIRFSERLGYAVDGRTATGNLRFVHKRTGVLVVAPRKNTDRVMENAKSQLRKCATKKYAASLQPKEKHS
jgi:hypothetical protein